MDPFTLVVLGGAATVGLLVARFYYGITPTDVGYYVMMHTPIGQMLHDTQLAKHKTTVHSLTTMHDAGSFLVRSVAYLEDNYAYLIVDKETGRTAVVDPGDAQRVLDHMQELQASWDSVHATGFSDTPAPAPPAATVALFGGVQARPELSTVLVTHYHHDHAGGNKELHTRVPELRIVGSQREAVPYATAVATHGAKFWLGKTEIDVFSTPCHTAGHVCYYAHGPKPTSSAAARKALAVAPADFGDEGADGGGCSGSADGTLIPASSVNGSSAAGVIVGPSFSAGALFTGDTLFVGGVGKFFEGTPEEMHTALYSTLRPVPPETPVFCGHEYAVDNLRFALWVDRGNKAVEEKLAWAMRRRSERRATVPSLLMEERQHNPFMRVHVPSLRAAVAERVGDARGREMPEIPVMTALRRLKDQRAHIAAGTGGMAAAPASSPSSSSAASASAGKGASSYSGGDAGPSASASSFASAGAAAPAFTGTAYSSPSSSAAAAAASSSAAGASSSSSSSRQPCSDAYDRSHDHEAAHNGGRTVHEHGDEDDSPFLTSSIEDGAPRHGSSSEAADGGRRSGRYQDAPPPAEGGAMWTGSRHEAREAQYDV